MRINNRRGNNLFSGRTQQGNKRRGGTHGGGTRGFRNTGGGPDRACDCVTSADCWQDGQCVNCRCSWMGKRSKFTNGDAPCPPYCVCPDGSCNCISC